MIKTIIGLPTNWEKIYLWKINNITFLNLFKLLILIYIFSFKKIKKKYILY